VPAKQNQSNPVGKKTEKVLDKGLKEMLRERGQV